MPETRSFIPTTEAAAAPVITTSPLERDFGQPAEKPIEADTVLRAPGRAVPVPPPRPQGPPGQQGPQGPQGIQGPAGPIGVTGPSGVQGPRGLQGPPGDEGPIGPQGDRGAPGIQGATGATGSQGPAGIQGPPGDEGPIGPQGDVGALGPVGPQGVQGVQGIQGPAGVQGPPGDEGPVGPQGDTGLQGAQGATGADGGQGPAGIQGPPGDEGPAGAQGDPGLQGIQGVQGIQGLPGHDGAQGPAGIQGPPGDEGPAGPQGDMGAPGVAGAAGAAGATGTSGSLPFTTVTEAGVGPFNDYVLPDLTVNSVTLIVSSASVVVFSGFVSGSGSNVDGMRFRILVGSNNLGTQLLHLSGLSLAANTIATPNAIVFTGHKRDLFELEYSGGDWRVQHVRELPNFDEIVNATATGALGTIDISALQCGGTYRVSAASSAYNIAGWTSTPVKPQGFWFNFVSEDTVDIVTLNHEDAGATAANRMLLPSEANVINKELRGQLVYQGSRWSWLGGNPRHIGSTSAAFVEVTAGGSVQASVPTNQITLTAGVGPNELIVNPAGTSSGATLNGFQVGFAPSSSTSQISTLTTTTNSTSIITPLSYTIPAGLPAGTSFEYYICVQVARGATLTAANIVVDWRTGGTTRYAQTLAINLAASFAGYIIMRGLFSYLGASGATTPCAITGDGNQAITSTTPALILCNPSLAITHATNATVVIDCRVNMSALVAGLSFTPVGGFIRRVR